MLSSSGLEVSTDFFPPNKENKCKESKDLLSSSPDSHPAASLSVSPDQTQHFITDALSLSLSCAGDSAAWTVNRISSSGYLTRCSTWGSMVGPTCTVIGNQFVGGVYWCESSEGQFSNAVNITGACECLRRSTPPQPRLPKSVSQDVRAT